MRPHLLADRPGPCDLPNLVEIGEQGQQKDETQHGGIGQPAQPGRLCQSAYPQNQSHRPQINDGLRAHIVSEGEEDAGNDDIPKAEALIGPIGKIHAGEGERPVGDFGHCPPVEGHKRCGGGQGNEDARSKATAPVVYAFGERIDDEDKQEAEADVAPFARPLHITRQEAENAGDEGIARRVVVVPVSGESELVAIAAEPVSAQPQIEGFIAPDGTLETAVNDTADQGEEGQDQRRKERSNLLHCRRRVALARLPVVGGVWRFPESEP